MTGSMLVRHSQSSSLPVCGDGEIKLWDGYSMLHIEGNGRAHHQDLGKATKPGANFMSQKLRVKIHLVEFLRNLIKNLLPSLLPKE